MGFFTVLARKGKRVARRKHQRSRLGNFKKVTKEDAKNWLKKNSKELLFKLIRNNENNSVNLK